MWFIFKFEFVAIQRSPTVADMRPQAERQDRGDIGRESLGKMLQSKYYKSSSSEKLLDVSRRVLVYFPPCLSVALAYCLKGLRHCIIHSFCRSFIHTAQGTYHE